jgi:hypothetical protein
LLLALASIVTLGSDAEGRIAALANGNSCPLAPDLISLFYTTDHRHRKQAISEAPDSNWRRGIVTNRDRWTNRQQADCMDFFISS